MSDVACTCVSAYGNPEMAKATLKLLGLARLDFTYPAYFACIGWDFDGLHVAGCNALASAELVCGINIEQHTLGFNAPVIWEQHAPGHWIKRQYLVLQVLGSKVVSYFAFSKEATKYAIEADAEQVFCLTHGPGGWYQTNQDVIDAARRAAREAKKAEKQLAGQALLGDGEP